MLGELDQQQTRKTSIQLGIPVDFVRKDFFVTKVIQSLTGLENKYFALIFQGGTSLSKGYQIIHRLSEDIDFRIIQKPMAATLGKVVRRKRLRDFRHALIQILRDTGFKIPEESIKVFYEGRFMRFGAEFDGSQKIPYLKPHVAVECFVGELALEPKATEITSLIRLTLGEECDHPFFPVTCVALDETAAEKWVALTRRISGTQIRSRQSDKHLVRHLYDLYYLKTSGLLTGDYRAIVSGIMEKDRIQFKKYNAAYVDDPLRTSELALDSLFKDRQWREHWDYFLEQMVYEEKKPSFDKAYGQLQQLSQEIFKTLKSGQR